MNYEFKSTSYESKTTGYEFKSTCYKFKSTSYKFKLTICEFKSTSYDEFMNDVMKSKSLGIVKSRKNEVNSLQIYTGNEIIVTGGISFTSQKNFKQVFV